MFDVADAVDGLATEPHTSIVKKGTHRGYSDVEHAGTTVRDVFGMEGDVEAKLREERKRSASEGIQRKLRRGL